MAKFFGPDQTELMAAVVDRLIPRDGESPSASEAGAVAFIDAAAARSSALPRLFLSGLLSIESESLKVGGARFAELRGELQDQVLRAVEINSSEFFEALVGQAYNAYYTNPAAVAALGIDPSPPQPVGYHVDAGDLSALENVIARGRAYREVAGGG